MSDENQRPPKSAFRRWAEPVLAALTLIWAVVWGGPLFGALRVSFRLMLAFLLELGAVLAVLAGLTFLFLGALYVFGRPAAVSFHDFCRQRLRYIFLKRP